jgi:hypothetical protein
VFEKAHRGGIKIARRLGLQAIGKHRKQKMSGEVRWCVVPDACAPSGPQRLEAETAQARDLGFDERALGRLGSDSGSRHGGSGLAAVQLRVHQRRTMIARDLIDPDTVDDRRHQIELEALAHDPGKKPTHRMRLPAGGFC